MEKTEMMQAMSMQELQTINGGALTKNEERLIIFALGGLFGLAIYEISCNQKKGRLTFIKLIRI